MSAYISHHDSAEQVLLNFIALYSQLNKTNLNRLYSVYAKDIVFEDPAHHIEGIDALFEYFESLYTNVNQCGFEIHKKALKGNSAFINWTLTMRHPKLSKGELRKVSGCSYLEFKKGKVSYHKDYFDLGALIYEGLPLMGTLIKAIKKRLGK